ncbi:GTPase [Prauserella oleivorans]|uniref:GTPase n=1 Tax=Prauserella oleivorans TaxID=1478153 RepID=A0ABW5W538_9PSEU
MSLPERTWALLDRALEAYANSPRATAWLRGHRARFAEPIRVAVAGPAGSGKSTLVRALAGDVEPAWQGQGVARFHVPQSRSQPELILVDTPAADGESAETGVVERACLDADALLYLTAHPHAADLSLPRTVLDRPVARMSPITTLVVLSRADELGGGRPDALVSARQVARRHRRVGELAAMCQDVVAVAGLAASGARTLSDEDFETVAALAAVPKEELEPLLLSVDRFAAEPGRQAVLARLGLFGVRLATTLVRHGATSRTALSAQLLQRSGFTDLRDSITRYLTEHAPVLKARSALLGLEVVLRMEPRPEAAALVTEFERTLAAAHEFAELRALSAVTTGRVRLPDELREEAVRLLGGYGAEPASRLGVEIPDPQRAFGALRRWQGCAANPVLGAAERRAAAVVVRSCEALVTGFR